MSWTFVQSATASTEVSFPSNSSASGTRGLGTATVSFGSSPSAGNLIVLWVMGDVGVPAAVVDIGPQLGFIFGISAGAPATTRNYWFQVTYTDGAGKESAAGQVATFTANPGDYPRVEFPNVNLGTIPGAVTWSLYASDVGPTSLFLQQSGIAANVFWQQSAPLIASGPTPPTKCIYDTSGGSFVTAAWQEQFAGGSSSGNNAAGIFYGVASGSNSIEVILGVSTNQNGAQNVAVCVVAAEFTVSSPITSIPSSGVFQQGSGSTPAPTLTTTTFRGRSIVSDWSAISGLGNGHVGMVVDAYNGVEDVCLALFENPLSGAIDPPTPTITATTYNFVAKVISPGTLAIPLWAWYSGSISAIIYPQVFVMT